MSDRRTRQLPGRRIRGMGVALAAILGQLAVTATGLLSPRGFELETLLFAAAPIALVTTMALWLLVVSRGGGRAALGCAVAAAASLVAFRLGITLPLAGAALVLARAAPLDGPPHERLGWLAMALAAVVLLAVAYLVAIDVLR